MQISVTDAKGQLTNLVRQAEAGHDIILTRHGHPAVRFFPVTPLPDRAGRRQLMEAVRASGSARTTPGPGAARSQDSLYDEDGLPARLRWIPPR